MRIIVIPLFLIFTLHAYGQNKRLPVKVTEATSRRWVSGADGRTGTKYTIRVYIRTAQKMEFINLWIGSKNVPFDIELYNLEIPKMIQQGDTVLLTYNQINGDTAEYEKTKRLPIDYKGEALIEATVGGKTRYFIVCSIQPVATLLGQ